MELPHRGGQRSCLPRVTSNYIIAKRTAQPQWLPTRTTKHTHTHTPTLTYTHTITGRHTLWDLTTLICWFAEFDFRFSPLLPLSFSLCVSLSHFFPIFISIILAAVVGVFVISMSGPALSVCRQQSLRSNELILALQWQPSQERGRSGHE